MVASGRLDRLYKDITHCFKRTVEGVISCVLGNTTNVFRYALNFTLKNIFKQFCDLQHKRCQYYGAAAGVSSSLFVPSLGYARTRLSDDGQISARRGQRQFSGLIDVYKQTLRSDGIVGLYRGFVPGVVSVCVYRGLYFGGYDTTRNTLLVGNLRRNFDKSFCCGLDVHNVPQGAVMAAYPLDTIRRRMMMTSGEKLSWYSKYFSTQIVAKEGARSLFAGAGANILRSVVGAGVLSLYDKHGRPAPVDVPC
ncbi:ADP,ATP carrier protein [Suillus lakei]|nr:ADP,ATP carrier protein [Suillus lakei]